LIDSRASCSCLSETLGKKIKAKISPVIRPDRYREGVSSQRDSHDDNGADDDREKMLLDVDHMFIIIGEVEGE